MQNQYTIQHLQKYFLIAVLLALVFTLFLFLEPFLSTLLFAGVIVAAVYPLHKMLNEKVRLPRWLSSLLTLVLILLLIVGPFTAFFFFIAGEAGSAYTALSAKISTLTQSDLGRWINWISAYVPVQPEALFKSVADLVGNVSSLLLAQTTTLLKSLSLVLIHFLVFVLALYYFIFDGSRLLAYIRALLPLSDDYRKEVFNKLKALSYGVIYGLFGAAIAQGFLLGLGFQIAGISNAAFWGTVAAFFSPIPYVGVSVIWVPATIVAAVQGQWWIALFLLVWNFSLVNVADNLVKPLLIGKSARLHPLAVLLVILGGVFAFGLKGLFFGPFILTLTLTFLHIYELEYKTVLNGKTKK